MPSFAELRFETPRLLLRPFTHTDAPELFTIYSDPEVFRYVPVGDWKHLDEAHQAIARAINMMATGEDLRFAMVRREDSRLVGDVLIFNFANEGTRAELGYALARSAWGCGYVSEALQPLVDHAFRHLQLRRLGATIDPRNEASARVLRRFGFTHEGNLREHTLMRGEVCGSGMYGLLRSDWEKKNAR